MHRVPGWLTALTGVSALVACHLACAQTARSGGNASAQLMQQMQQLASERTTLQAENDKLKKQLADITKDRDALKAGQQAVDRRAKDSATALQHSNAQREAVDNELTQTKAKMQEIIGKFRETITKMREIETENIATKQTLATRERELSVCASRNVDLYKLNDEILTRLDKKSSGLGSCMASAEPFTKIGRVRNENLVDDYRSRAQNLQVAPVVKPPASAGGTTPTNAPAVSSAPVAPNAPSASPGVPAPAPTASPAPASPNQD
jgi:chromosome segregation ATPase